MAKKNKKENVTLALSYQPKNNEDKKQTSKVKNVAKNDSKETLINVTNNVAKNVSRTVDNAVNNASNNSNNNSINNDNNSFLKLANERQIDIRTNKLEEQQKEQEEKHKSEIIKNTTSNKYDEALRDSNNYLKDAENEFKLRQNEYQEKRSKELQKKGIDFQNKFEDKTKQQISYQTKNEDMSINKPKEIDAQTLKEVDKKLKKENNEREEALNEWKYAQYVNEEVKNQSKKVNTFDKTLGNAYRAAADLFSLGTLQDRTYKDSDGNTVYLPTYNDLRQQKVSDSYNTGVGKFLGDTVYNGTKILGATGLDVLTGGIGGKALYWTDMATDNYTNVKNQGYSGKQALANTLVSTGSEYLTEKMLGGLTKNLTGGKASGLQNALANKLMQKTGKAKLSNALAGAASEGLEEFTQEYIDKINDLATLKNSTNPQDYVDAITSIDNLKSALYSGGIGMATGGTLNAMNNVDGKQVQENIDFLNQYREELVKAKNSLSNQQEKNVYDGAINKINDYNKQPFSSSFNDTFDSINPTNLSQRLNEVRNQDIANASNNFNLGKNDTVTKPNINNNTERIANNNQVENYKSKSFDSDMLKFESGKYTSNDNITLLDNTPEYFYNLGYDINKPVVINMDKFNSISQEKGTIDGKNQHGITKELLEQIPKAISNPLNVIKNPKFKNRFVVITELSDKYGDIVVVPIEIDTSGKQNKVVTIYGKEQYDGNDNPNIKGYMEQNKNNIVYDIDLNKQKKSYSLEAPIAERNNSSIKNIPQTNQNVNLDISNNSNMQQNKNNSIKDRNNPNVLYETKEPNDILVIKNDIQNKPLTKETTSDEINYILNGNKGESKFYKNITENSQFISEENRNKLSKEDNIKFYDKVTNEESLQEAQERLDNMGENAIVDFFSDKKQVDSVDIATGWILLKRFQDIGDYDSMTQVAKKMRTMGTKAGQAIQTFNIMSRLTPEGMVKYAQSELMEAYDKFSENKSKKWIDENRDNFGLTPEETQFIVDTMKKVEAMEDGYDKKVELAKIQKMLQDKLPPEKGQGIKSWMRISMLFNPKTQIRNIVGNAAITPVNAVADVFSATADKILSKKTGVRTSGMANIGAYLKGSKQGIYEATNDFKLGINTKDVNQNRFEVGQGKAFNERMKGVKSIFNPLSKVGNKVDNILNYALDVGDRAFSQGAFNQSIQNQMILNNTTEITQDMIDIAEQEALSRTWNDDNDYTKFVLEIRRRLNKVGPKSYGLGDVLIPFAKTPANLTKAIVDYSPVGVVNTLLDVNKVKNNIETGRFTPQMQHEFVQKLGKATAGTMLYILGYALAKSKITSGNSDDDKDVADFMRNTLGIQPYSIKIGDKSFTYDWAQPVAAPLAFMADIEKAKSDKQSLKDAIISVSDTGFNLLMEQSFMQSINEVLSGYGSPFEKIGKQVLGLPARAVPTFLKQINDMIDSKTRMVYEKDSPTQSAVNQVKTKIPGLSTSLPVKRDTLGRKVNKYGGNNNFSNVFINPANVNKGKVSESAKEIYAIYEATKDKRIMPREPDSKLNLNNKDKSEFLKISGNIIDENVKSLKNDDDYSDMSNEDKAQVIKNIVDYAYNKAKSEITGKEISNNYKKAKNADESGYAIADYYITKSVNSKTKKSTTTDRNRYQELAEKGIDGKTFDEFKYFISNVRADKDSNGNSIRGSKKQKIIDYINNLPLSAAAKQNLYDDYNDNQGMFTYYK